MAEKATEAPATPQEKKRSPTKATIVARRDCPLVGVEAGEVVGTIDSPKGLTVNEFVALIHNDFAHEPPPEDEEAADG